MDAHALMWGMLELPWLSFMLAVAVRLYLHQMRQEGAVSRRVKERDDPLALRFPLRDKAR